MRTKFMLSLRAPLREKIAKEAAERGLTIQEFIRAVIIPTYYQLKIDISLPKTELKSSVIEPFIRRNP